VINEYEAEAVRMIFRMYLDGYSYTEIIDALNAKGYRTRRGVPFAKNSLYAILRNERYTGVYIYVKDSIYSGTAAERAEALMNFYKDEEIRAIFDISGGDIANEILPYLDFEVIGKMQKQFWGYSDLTTIINAISYILIAFVSISLIVSSIMIGIITYISVLERTKEIGVLRAIGASKRNISSIFNAETFIVGLFSGVLGILTTIGLLIPTNLIIHSVNSDISAVLPIKAAIVLVILSVILTLIGGLSPSRQAAKKDPVLALRSE
jgi:ABC-type antimicrobial peptide transport system permease subunit